MKSKVNWGIIGAGGIAKRRTLPAMEQVTNGQVIAIMDKNEEVLEELSEKYQIPNTAMEEKELLENKEIEAVYVASPVCYHKQQALEVLHAGKHLLLEKPLAMNAADARQIAEAAKRQNSIAGVAMVMRHHSAHKKIKKMIADHTIGQVVCCRAQLNCWFPKMKGNWRQNPKMAGGGALVDMGTHCIDLLRFLLDDEVEWVFGDISTKTFSYEVDDSADCILHMTKGASCFIDVHFNIPDEAAKGMLEIYGTKGSILARGTIGQDGQGEVFLNLCDSSQEYHSEQVRSEPTLGKKVEYEWENLYGTQIQSFSRAILEKEEATTSLEDAYETVCVVDALYQSSREKRAVWLRKQGE